jgi:uncharacterized protein
LIIQFDDIPPDGLRLFIDDLSWFPEEFDKKGSSKVDIELERQENNLVFLWGDIQATLVLQCDRCLEKFEFPLSGRFKVDFELVKNSETAVVADEHFCSASEMDTILLDRPEIDIDEVLAQQVRLSVPIKNVCSDNCRGICPQCGANLNIGDDTCRCQAVSESPFKTLSKLINS